MIWSSITLQQVIAIPHFTRTMTNSMAIMDTMPSAKHTMFGMEYAQDDLRQGAWTWSGAYLWSERLRANCTLLCHCNLWRWRCCSLTLQQTLSSWMNLRGDLDISEIWAVYMYLGAGNTYHSGKSNVSFQDFRRLYCTLENKGA